MLPAAQYAAVVSPVTTDFGRMSVQFGTSSKKGTQQCAVCFEILRGPQAGQKVTWIGYFTDATIERTLNALRICGFEGDDVSSFPGQSPENEVSIVVEHEEYDGKVRVKVAWVNEPGGGGMKMANPFDDKALRKFGAQLKGTLKAMPAVKTKKAVREEPTEAPSSVADDMGEPGNTVGDDADDLPF